MIRFDDNTLMRFGKYKGYKLANVPPDYLLFLLDQDWLRDGPLKDYIKKNESTLKKEIELNRKMKYK